MGIAPLLGVCACGKQGDLQNAICDGICLGKPIYLCRECDEKLEREIDWEMLGRHCVEDRIICPYCDYEFPDSWEIQDDQDEYECEYCNRKFDIVVQHNTTYSTTRSLCEMPEDWVND